MELILHQLMKLCKSSVWSCKSQCVIQSESNFQRIFSVSWQTFKKLILHQFVKICNQVYGVASVNVQDILKVIFKDYSLCHSKHFDVMLIIFNLLCHLVQKYKQVQYLEILQFIISNIPGIQLCLI